MERATISILAVASLAALAAVRVASAAPFGQDSILVSIEDDQIREYGPTGTLIQTISVPYPINPAPSSARVRDLVITQSGQLAIFNGTFDPYVSVHDPTLDTWHHETFLGWSTSNNDRFAGIATIGPYVFVSDARTFGDGGADELKGVIRFDTLENLLA